MNELLPALSEYIPRILPQRPYGKVLVNPVVRRRGPDGWGAERLSLAPPGEPVPPLPLGAKLAAHDCHDVESILDCGVEVGDAMVILGNDLMRGGQWLLQVFVHGPLNDRGYLGGAHFLATFTLRDGCWQLEGLRITGVP